MINKTIIPVIKTVYLIRHAESEENRRLATLVKSLNGLRKGKWPSRVDVVTSMELLNVGSQIDSSLSKVGKKQIEQIGSILRQDDFLNVKGVELIAHSPLERVRQTSQGLLGSVAPRCNKSNRVLPSSPSGVRRVVELDFLKERTPLEWLPVNHDAFTSRIAQFEKWLCEQPEKVIVVVGHSQYFKSMLGLDYKFDNCDIWELKFDPLVQLNHETVKLDVSLAERTAKNKKFTRSLVKGREKLEESLNFVTSALGTSPSKTSIKIDGFTTASSPVSDIQPSSDFNPLLKENHPYLSSVSKRVEDKSIMINQVMQRDEYSIGTDLDINNFGMDERVSKYLPRGWKKLKRLYKYNPKI